MANHFRNLARRRIGVAVCDQLRANVGAGTPVFEPVHGSAPDIAGQGIANPVGAMLSSVLMLETLGEPAGAASMRKAVLDTLASGVCTTDLGGVATTKQFTRAVIDRLK